MKNNIRIKFVERLDLGELATFVPNKDKPIHNWFHFKEGFSRDLVAYILNKHLNEKKITVLDPFTGVGTTPLTCREIGIPSIGIEVNPLFHFIANAKTRIYNPNNLRRWIEWISKQKYRPVDTSNIHPLVKKAFNIHNLRDILFFKKIISSVEDEEARTFLLMGLINAASKVTYAYKDGAIIRFRPKPTPPFRKIYLRTLRKMIRDIERVELKPVDTTIYLGDARKMDMIDDESIDLIITSPPYLNKIEYTKVYEIETRLFLGENKVIPLRSYIGLITRKHYPELPIDTTDMPKSAQAYFHDLWQVIKELNRVMKDDAYAYIVVAEGLYRDRKIPVDEILAEMAIKEGFRKAEIWIVNKRIVTIERTIKLGTARESIIRIVK